MKILAITTQGQNFASGLIHHPKFKFFVEGRGHEFPAEVEFENGTKVLGFNGETDQFLPFEIIRHPPDIRSRPTRADPGAATRNFPIATPGQKSPFPLDVHAAASEKITDPARNI